MIARFDEWIDRTRMVRQDAVQLGMWVVMGLADMTYRYLTFASEWWVFAAEFALISHYHPEWNESGFGSKVPGVGRPGTHRVSRWDEQFPRPS